MVVGRKVKIIVKINKMERNYCNDCGKIVHLFSEYRCHKCGKKLCSNCKYPIKTNDTNDYCTNCTITLLQTRLKRIEQKIICGNCGNESPRIDCVYCSFCGNLLRKDKIIKLSDPNKEEKENGG